MPNLYKITLLGDGGVGKSAITNQFLNNQFLAHYDPTIEESYRRQMEIDGKICMLDILDTAGQEEYKSMRERYIQGGQGFLLVFSVTSPLTLQSLKEIHELISQVKDTPNPPVVLVGNKADLTDQRLVSKEEGDKMAESFSAPYFETSAKTNVNIQECFFELVRVIQKKIRVDAKSNRKFRCMIL
ncbi:ras di-ras and rheb family members of small gtpase superfamily [Anaeramoeba ignava]|uniref:small monomeric GTPase n=1 Tax=Anaeramoeba ignava TaxID=1746090 RepID=A0A9Q0L8U1_ANAIG|nr:ras di-ras and rheb family members of small gtpase superfamily [Anaeramoeba ignava]